MKRFIPFLAIAFLSLSCAATRYYVQADYQLYSVDRGDTSVLVYQGKYEDDLLSVSLCFNEDNISLDLTNKSRSSLKILWDDASYIDFYGNAHRIIHTGVKLIDRDKAQVPSVVPKASKLRDEVVPTDCIEYVPATRYKSSSWSYKPINSIIEYDNREDALTLSDASRDMAVSLLLPVESNGNIIHI